MENFVVAKVENTSTIEKNDVLKGKDTVFSDFIVLNVADEIIEENIEALKALAKWIIRGYYSWPSK